MIKYLMFFVCLIVLLTSKAMSVQPYPESEYERRYKQLMNTQAEPQPPINRAASKQYFSREPGFDKKNGERILEGYVLDIKKLASCEYEFKLKTKFWGDLNVRLVRETRITPSFVSFKEGEYAVIRQYRTKAARSVDIIPVWDAKKRDLWFEYVNRK